MSFVTLDHFASRRADHPATAFSAQDRHRIAKTNARAFWRYPSDQYLLLVIAALLLAIGAAFFFQPNRLAAGLLFGATDFRATCSAERDCFIASSITGRTRNPELGMVPEAGSPARPGNGPGRAPDDDVTGSTVSYGALVVPPSHWSSPAGVSGGSLPAVQTSTQRLSAAMAAASGPSKRPATRRDRQRKAALEPDGPELRHR